MQVEIARPRRVVRVGLHASPSLTRPGGRPGALRRWCSQAHRGHGASRPWCDRLRQTTRKTAGCSNRHTAFCAGCDAGPFVYPRNYKGVLSRRWLHIFEHRGPRYHRPDAQILPNTRRRCSTFAVNPTAETSYPQGCGVRAVRHCKLTPGNNDKAPQLHTFFLHIAVDNCEQQVETFRRNL